MAIKSYMLTVSNRPKKFTMMQINYVRLYKGFVFVL